MRRLTMRPSCVLMSRHPRFRPDDAIRSLRQSQKLLAGSAWLQIPVAAAYLVHWRWLDQAFPWLILAVVVLACFGFAMVNQQVGLFGAALDAMPEVMAESRYNRATLARFMLLFLVIPGANLMVIGFSYIQAGDAIRAIERTRQAMKEREQAAARQRSGASEALRTAPARTQN